VAFDPLPEFTESGHISARHLDDKAGVAALLAALKAIVDSGRQPLIDCHRCSPSPRKPAAARRRPALGCQRVRRHRHRPGRPGQAPANMR
jgi:hypothetical protein